MKAFVGLIMGSGLTFLFLEFGFTPPVPFQLPDKLKAIPVQIIASSFLEDADSELKQQQHAVATLIKYDSNYFVEIDNAIANRFTKEAMNKIANRKVQLLKNYSTGITRAFDAKKYPALRKHLEKRYGVTDEGALSKKVMVERIREDAFVHKILQERFPESSDEEIAETILGVPRKQ